MKNILPLMAVGVVGLVLGYGLTATITYAQLDQVAESAKTLQLSPISAPAQNFAPAAGGSCG